MMRTAILTDGDLPGLIAMSAEAETRAASADTGRPVILLASTLGRAGLPDARTLKDRVARQADLAGLDHESVTLVGPGDDALVHPETDLLLRAAGLASAKGCRRLVVALGRPEGQPEPDLNDLAAGLDRATLIGRLVSIDPGPSGVGLAIDRPYDDLSDEQLADLALDLDAPVESVWSNPETGGAHPALFERWGGLVEGFGAVLSSDPGEVAQRRAERLS